MTPQEKGITQSPKKLTIKIMEQDANKMDGQILPIK